MKTLADQVAPLVAEAKRLGGHAPSCSRPEVPEIARVTVEGWSLCLDMHEHDGVGHFGFSAKLFPAFPRTRNYTKMAGRSQMEKPRAGVL